MPDPSPNDPDGTHFTLLGEDDGPGRFVDEDRLAQLYAYPADVTGCVVRGNMITSLDGGASTDGTSGGLGEAGDRRLFRVLRELADVIVVGAGTARAENYSGAQMTLTQRSNRQRRGQSEVPPIALVTRSGRLDRDVPVLTRTEVAPLVLTCRDAAADARSRLGGAAEVIACSAADPAEVDPGTVLTALAERGLPRVLCEGGPTLMGTFIEHGLLDELCLTTAPMLVGGSAPRIVTGAGHVLAKMRRQHLISDAEGYLYGRYTRAG
ncbi:pyrimidine reductase family protein [Mycobacterium sp. CVI_P3]|uniref:Pyrimidine reductase family protein n=1 Tax=Mycobacterium pinniadriaticum TaxID=2994102 RepID=A0ABT3SJG0_9MYCO|nr:pyrimidine reductase family protein [Mycobacterium pinniadriaticum]MCX2932840.1 pyrimidine reductase family protein [Mycobacterium pinniadriaticum]MCX2939264.1 pyrimidine reductase family protein [Mycobacterium pinniadriaticum]